MSAPPPRARLASPLREEALAASEALNAASGTVDWAHAAAIAAPWVHAVRERPAPFWAMESLLREFPISTAEGLALMRLAEALLRVPDTETAIALTADQLGRAHFDEASSDGDGPHRVFASLSASAIALSKKLLPDDPAHAGLWQRLGAQTVVAATVRAVQLLGRQFVLGRNIGEALDEARSARRSHAPLRFSFDMLGEGARSDADAQRYLASYAHAIDALADDRVADSPQTADGISIKLSALFARFEDGQRERVFDELLPRAWQLVDRAARANLNLTIDAEESDRLELSLDLLEALAQRIAREHPAWTGFGLAVQAYQTRSLDVASEVVRIARANKLRLMVRLVKGAYWDFEIKRAQEMGLPAYPVFTHKTHTDLAYLACASRLFANADVVFPQFATHNAGTVSAVVLMAQQAGAAFEMQRLHGMGEGLYREVMREPNAPSLRVYAPVGEHRDLLAYLVRRLLENGANSSFVHQVADARVDVSHLLRSPLRIERTSALPLPRRLYGDRLNSMGRDLACVESRASLMAAIDRVSVPVVALARADDVDALMRRLQHGYASWHATPLEARCDALARAADALQSRLDEFAALLVHEGRKTPGDAVSEVREAIDFCRYYAQQARTRLAPQTLPGPTGEDNQLRWRGRGVFVCISPWNFPLAIFSGQVVAALVAGNAVAAKPAEQTPAVAARMVALLHEAGVPNDALTLLHGPGETIGAALVAHPLTAGVCFTGSTAVARAIARSLAAKDGPLVPLIAETGGLNAMIVDSSALPEQVVDAVVQSAFRSAGQRCSALRLLCVHDAIADGVIHMLRGAMAELQIGDPRRLSTDVGPVIDAQAQSHLLRHIERLRREATCLGESARIETGASLLIAPVAFELGDVGQLKEEIFGPVLHVVRWSGDALQLVDKINQLGYGLTLGIQTRIDSRAQRIAAAAQVGNVYVNRNMIGAVVGVQPFGGEGLSGTGPKAGGPNYLPRFCAEQTVTINTAAAGGNAELLTGAGS